MSVTKQAEPVQIELKSKLAEMRLDWDDGHHSIYPLWYLRGFCPCAECQGHVRGWTFIPSERAEIAKIEEVGNYAINLVWKDGHRTGIYSFEVLRELCPCSACRGREGHPVGLIPSEHNRGL